MVLRQQGRHSNATLRMALLTVLHRYSTASKWVHPAGYGISWLSQQCCLAQNNSTSTMLTATRMPFTLPVFTVNAQCAFTTHTAGLCVTGTSQLQLGTLLELSLVMCLSMFPSSGTVAQHSDAMTHWAHKQVANNGQLITVQWLAAEHSVLLRLTPFLTSARNAFALWQVAGHSNFQNVVDPTKVELVSLVDPSSCIRNLNTVRSSLVIFDDGSIPNLSALANLRTVVGPLYIYGMPNATLTTLAGLENLQVSKGLMGKIVSKIWHGQRSSDQSAAVHI